MTGRFFRIAIILGLLSAVGPFAIDMYLPALPSIGADLSASTGAVQMTLLAFFLSLGVGQIFVGPISDMVGRKAPLYAGLGLFALGGIGAALSPTIEWLIAFRFVQGLGACAGMVVPRAIVRDLHTGPEATRLMSLLMLVFSVSPLLAPLTGSFIIASLGWRAIFWVVTVAAAIGMLLLFLFQAETRPPEDRQGSSLTGALSSYGRLLRDRHFLALTFIGGFGTASFFVYLSSSSFIFIDHFGLSPLRYSLAFSFNAISFFTMAQLTGTLTERFGLQRVVRVAVVGYLASMLVLLALTLAGLRPHTRSDGASFHRLRISWADHSHDFRPGSGRAWADRRRRIGVDGNAAIRGRCACHGRHRRAFQRNDLADGRGHCRLRACFVRFGADDAKTGQGRRERDAGGIGGINGRKWRLLLPGASEPRLGLRRPKALI